MSYDVTTLIEEFCAAGERVADHPPTCNCPECLRFIELADSVANTPMARLEIAVRTLAKQRVMKRAA